MSEARRQIGSLMGTARPVMVMLGAADRFMELAVRSLVRRRLLVLVDGPQGELMAGIAEACGREVARTGVAPGLTMQPEWLERFLRGPECDAVALVHSEGDGNAPALLPELAAVARRRGVFVIADLTHSLGRLPVETDAWGLDLVFAAGAGALEGPEWVSVGAASARAVERARLMPARGMALDLVAHHEAAEEEMTLDPLPQPLDVLFSGLRS